MYKLVISDDEGKTIIVPLVRDLITIGRQEGNTIRLTERNVSRQHARLVRVDDGFRVEDLDAYNGVYVNDERIEGSRELKDADRIRVGDYALVLRSEVEAVAGEAASDGPRPSGPVAESVPARLVMVSAPAPGAEFSLTNDSVRIGRLEELELCISHRSISREHAEMRRTEEGYTLRDLGSANGVRVNGALVEEKLLRSGDLVDLGQVRFRFVGPGEPYSFETEELVGGEAKASGGRLRTALMLAVVMLVAGVLALLDDDSVPSDSLPVQAEPLSRSTPQETLSADGAEIAAQVAAALSGCREHISNLEFDSALRAAQNGLMLDEENGELITCRDDARRGMAERETFAQGRAAFESGDIDAAYVLFAGLAKDSPLRREDVFSRVATAYAQDQLKQARAQLTDDPDATARIAGDVVAIEEVGPELRAEARALRTQAETAAARPPEPVPQRRPRKAKEAQRQRPVRAATTSTASKDRSQDSEPVVSPARLARSCLARGDQKCAVRALEGRARTAQELALLIETYRALGDTGRAVRNMHLFVKRYPAAPQADGYKTFIARNNP